jgi:photosystem II stability/assembly factor-like uncharacterized protein
MLSRSGFNRTLILCFSFIIFLSLVFLSLPSQGPGGGLALADPGSGWEDQSLGYTFYDADRTGVAVIDADNAWVVGSKGSILRTKDGGATWEPQASGTTYYIDDISAVNGDVAWAAGYRTILRTTDGGETWVKKGEGLIDSAPNLVAAVDANTVWVAYYNSLIKTTDGGATWTTVYQGSTYGYQISDMYAEDAGTLWAAGTLMELIDGSAKYTGVVLKTNDGGASWTTLFSDPDGYSYSAISAGGSSIWISANDGTMIKTVDGGLNWTSGGNPLAPDNGLWDLSVVDSNTAWALGSYYNFLEIYVTTNGGASWESIWSSEGGGGISSIGAVDGTTAWAVGSGGTILKTTDGGEVWSPQIDTSLGLKDNLVCVSAVDSNTAWAASRDILLKTTDGGEDWVVVSNSYEYGISIYDIYAVDENTLWAVGAQSGKGVIYKTSDGGTSWSLQYNYFSPPYFTSVSAVDAFTAWVVGANGAIVKTTDGGGTWINQYSGTSRDLRSVLAVDADRAWATGWSVGYTPTYWSPLPPYTIPLPNYPILLRTSDGGTNWVANQYGTYNEGFNDVAVCGGDAIAVGNDIIYSPIPVYVYVFDSPMPYYGLEAIARYDAIVTHDNAGNWALQQVYSGGSYFEGIDMVGSEIVWMVSRNGVIEKSGDGAVTWVSQPCPGSAILHELDAVDVLTAWVVGDNGVIFKTSGGGDLRPDIVSLAPTAGDVGTEVTITGLDFGSTQGSSYVTFGGIAATAYTSWSDDVIVAKVPAGVAGQVKVNVITSEGTSNDVQFEGPLAPVTVASITPNTAAQFTWAMNFQVSGSGFQPGATVRLEKGAAVLNAYNVNVVSNAQINCTVGLFGAEPGAYDVVVVNPDGGEARLPGAFTVNSMCGAGSSTALLMLGLTLGLLSLAGTARWRKRGWDSN